MSNPGRGRGAHLIVSLCCAAAVAIALLPSIRVDAAPASDACVGDCNGDGVVTVNELVVGVNIANGNAAIAACPAFDVIQDGTVTINELILAVNNLLFGCGNTRPTATPLTATPSQPATPGSTATPTPPFRSETPTASPTRTKKPTKTVTPTPTNAPSVCGGNIQSLPVVCNLTILPNPVSRSGTIAFRFGISDLDGDITGICIGLSYPPLEPQTSCTSFNPTNRVVNGFETTTPISASPLQFGSYGAAVQAFDAAGNASNVATAAFQVQ